jgi:hypothetical protein
MEDVSITITQWEKYNPRNDLKSMNWFRLENKLPEHPAFFELSVSGKWFFVWLLCQCAKKMDGSINLKMTYCVHFSGVGKKEIIETLQILEAHELIRNEHVTNTNENVPNRQTNERTNERTNSDVSSYFDYWNNYASSNGYSNRVVSKLTPARIKKIKEYNKYLPLPEFEKVVQTAFSSTFLTKQCKAFCFDWLFQKGKSDQIENYIKVLEGKYNDKAGGSKFERL